MQRQGSPSILLSSHISISVSSSTSIVEIITCLREWDEWNESSQFTIRND